MVITLRVICPQNQDFFQFFSVGINALEILNIPLLLSYTIIVLGVYNKTKVSDCQYDRVVKCQGHTY